MVQCIQGLTDGELAEELDENGELDCSVVLPTVRLVWLLSLVKDASVKEQMIWYVSPGHFTDDVQRAQVFSDEGAAHSTAAGLGLHVIEFHCSMGLRRVPSEPVPVPEGLPPKEVWVSPPFLTGGNVGRGSSFIGWEHWLVSCSPGPGRVKYTRG